jgi:hypothetical protein
MDPSREPLKRVGIVALAVAAACSDPTSGSDLLDQLPNDGATQDTGDDTPEKTVLDERVVDYGEALRTASLKLVDALPTLDQIRRVERAGDPQTAYEALLDELMADPRHVRRTIRWWRDVMVEGKPYGEIFTATENTCPSYDADAAAFVDGNCDNGVTQHAGVLTNPGSMAQFYGNMAFRRVRWVQEVFVCTKFPAEVEGEAVPMGAGQYTSPWGFDSISDAPIDFRDTSAVICANCHTTLNHVAPLFANFDADGVWRDSIQVMTPTAPEPVATELGHWLVDGETTAWRVDVPVDSLPELGAVLSADPDVRECLTARLWNFVMSKEDIVSGLATVPRSVIDPYVKELASSGDLRAVLRAMFASEDFTSF